MSRIRSKVKKRKQQKKNKRSLPAVWLAGFFLLALVVVVLIFRPGEEVAKEQGASPAAIDAIYLESDSVNLSVGETRRLLVGYTPADASVVDLSWSSDNESVAKVDASGTITGVSVGSCTVTVSSKGNPGVRTGMQVNVTGSQGQNDSSGSQGLTYIKGILVVNKTYSLPQDYNPGEDPVARAAFNRMKEAAGAEGLNLVLSSSFRSYSRQAALYSSYVSQDGQAAADKYSARPGHSEHQTGLAFDLSPVSDAFAGTPEALWVAENCHKYGFIIRYPKGKEAITGYQYEPWHLRYLGVDAASKVAASGLCLEEYLGVDSRYP